MIYQAGQIGLLEWVLIVIGILWLAGILRNTVYVPVVIKEDRKKEEEQGQKINESTTITKPKKDEPGEYVPFEEIKD